MEGVSLLLDRVKSNLISKGMINKGEGIVVGVSGGPDSLCLLYCLNSLKNEFELSIYVVHINHMIRGNDADQDQEFVEKLCRTLSIPCYSFKIPIREIAKSKKLSEEECGREVRYEKFFEVMKQTGASRVAVAQNMNDQAETIIMRITRGSGLQGICGIEWNSKSIIRPLLNITRKEIEEFCALNDIKPRIDKTNFEEIYTRNKIRLVAIPYIKKHLNENIVEILYKMGELLKEDNNYIDIKSIEGYNLCINKKCHDRLIFNLEKFNQQHQAIKTRIIRIALENLLGDLKGIEYKHIEYILKHIQNPSGKSIEINRNIAVYNNYGKFEIIKKSSFVETFKDFCYNIDLNGETYIEELNLHVVSMVKDVNELAIEELCKQKDIMLLNYEKFKDKNIMIRNRREGDRVQLEFGSKKLKDLFIDMKIDKRNRDSVPILDCEGKILWIIGYRKIYKYDENSQKVLIIKYIYK